jgi:cyclophilin family peptidyl-prolyl cis-trans isomerase
MESQSMSHNWQIGRQSGGWRVFGSVFLGLCLVGATVPAAPVARAACVPQDDPLGPIERWQAAFSELNALAGKARTVPANQQEELWNEIYTKQAALMELRKEIEPQLLQLVSDSTEIAQPLQDTMLQLARFSIRDDNYQNALKLLKPLVDSSSKDPEVYQYAALSAFGADQFQMAQELINKVKAEGGELRIDFLRRIAPELSERIEDWKKEEVIRAAEAEKDDLPRVKFETTSGDITIELYEDQAPNTVANFISLVEKGYYDGLTFHRVLPQFMAQGGCPNGTGAGGPGYSIPCECHEPNFRKHFSGTLSMAHAGRDTGGSQFFLTFLATPHLDGQHTAFGRVIEGMDAVAGLNKVNPERPNPELQPSKIVKATVLRKREHEYKPTTLPASR